MIHFVNNRWVSINCCALIDDTVDEMKYETFCYLTKVR